MISESWTIGLRTGVCLKWWTYPVGWTSEKEIWCLCPLISLLNLQRCHLDSRSHHTIFKRNVTRILHALVLLLIRTTDKVFGTKHSLSHKQTWPKSTKWQKHPPFRKRPYIRVQKLTIKQINKEITLSACTMKCGQPYPGSLWSCNERQSILIKPQNWAHILQPPAEKKKVYSDTKSCIKYSTNIEIPGAKLVLSWPQTVIKKELNWWFLKIFIFAYIIILCTTCQVQKRTFQSSLGLEASFVCESVYFNFESSRKKQEFPTNQLLPQIIEGFEKKITLKYI